MGRPAAAALDAGLVTAGRPLKVSPVDADAAVDASRDDDAGPCTAAGGDIRYACVADDGAGAGAGVGYDIGSNRGG